jgi:hypothetical protein
MAEIKCSCHVCAFISSGDGDGDGNGDGDGDGDSIFF